VELLPWNIRRHGPGGKGSRAGATTTVTIVAMVAPLDELGDQAVANATLSDVDLVDQLDDTGHTLTAAKAAFFCQSRVYFTHHNNRPSISMDFEILQNFLLVVLKEIEDSTFQIVVMRLLNP